jgi:creatinine amidohydrolase/Fe(II)-dependent formamide hydrolase-like protein
MMAAYPGLVKPGPYPGLGSDFERGKLAESFQGYRYLLPEGGAVYVAWVTHDLTPDGVVGNPAKADLEKGEEDLAFMVERVEAILREIAVFEFHR